MSAKNKAHQSARDVIGSVASTAVLFDGTMTRACRFISRFAPACVILMAASQVVIAAGDAERGAKLFRNCLACHSVEAGRHLTGPSLANLWGRKAGTAEGFLRYSDALKNAGVVWSEQTLDKWLKDSRDFIPGNEMSFSGIKEQQPRQDLIAFLKAVSEGKKPLAGGMTGNVKINLKNPGPRGEVKSMRHCGDTYFVTTVEGRTRKFWEFNLRLKTDSSDYGPAPGRPVVVGTGMQGDRSAVVFASPNEISSFVRQECQ